MYSFVLVLHSWLRWVALAAGLYATARAFNRSTDKSGLWFVAVMDLQLVLGLVLYFALSPVTAAAMEEFGQAMRTSSLRFFAVEHTTLMIVAVVFAHVGRASQRRGRSGRSKWFYAAAVVAMLAAIPWPGMANGRPWLRF